MATSFLLRRSGAMCLQRNPAVRGAKGSRGWDWFYKAKESADGESVETAAFPENTSGIPRQKAFLDISIGSEPQGRVVIELASDLVPRASQNFLDLCEGDFSIFREGDLSLLLRLLCFSDRLAEFESAEADELS